MTLFAAVGVTAVVGILPPFITKAFDFLIPALFGGMLVNIGMYQWRYLVVTVVAALALFLVGVPAKFITLIMVVFMIGLSYFFYKRGIWVPKAPMASAATED
jgi:predicted branched-subunit amino acid permease